MVATIEESIFRQASDGQLRVVGWTVDQYETALNQGWLAEDTGTELIGGIIVQKDRSAHGEDPMTIGDRHRMTVMRLGKLLPRLEAFGCFIQTQQPIRLPPSHAPEPDGAVIRGDIEDYADRPAGPADILSVIEVADSSLLRDMTIKLRVYAAAGVPVYVVIDLQHDVVLVHRDPLPDGSYPPPAELGRGETLSLPTGGGHAVEVAVDRLL